MSLGFPFRRGLLLLLGLESFEHGSSQWGQVLVAEGISFLQCGQGFLPLGIGYLPGFPL